MTDLEYSAYEPGSFGCHEALHMASFLADTVNDQLVDHPAILANHEWRTLAQKASRALLDLYYAIGKEHL